MRKIFCANKHRMVEIVPGLALCQCSSYGRLSNLKGAVAEARDVVARAGGIEALLRKVEIEEAMRKDLRAKPAAKREAIRDVS